MRAPEAGEFTFFVTDFMVFMVAGCGYGWNLCVNETARIKPFLPIAVFIGGVDQIACVNDEVGMGGIGIRCADRAGPERKQIVLRIAKVDEGKGFEVF